MSKDIKILCVCRSGNVRSVATKRCLNRRGYKNVIAVGSYVVPEETLEMLTRWADIILLAKPSHGKYIRSVDKEKISRKFDIGDDTWGTPVNWKLEEIIENQLDILKL